MFLIKFNSDSQQKTQNFSCPTTPRQYIIESNSENHIKLAVAIYLTEKINKSYQHNNKLDENFVFDLSEIKIISDNEIEVQGTTENPFDDAGCGIRIAEGNLSEEEKKEFRQISLKTNPGRWNELYEKADYTPLKGKREFPIKI